MQKLFLPVLLVCAASLLGGCVYDEEYSTGYYDRRPSYNGSGYVRRDVVYENRPYYYDNQPRYYGYDRSSYYDRGYARDNHRHYDRDWSDRRKDDDDHRKHHDHDKDRDKDKDRKKDNDRSSDSRGRMVSGQHYRERIYVKDDDKKDKKKKDD